MLIIQGEFVFIGFGLISTENQFKFIGILTIYRAKTLVYTLRLYVVKMLNF
jgi:hypothetical protein